MPLVWFRCSADFAPDLDEGAEHSAFRMGVADGDVGPCLVVRKLEAQMIVVYACVWYDPETDPSV